MENHSSDTAARCNLVAMAADGSVTTAADDSGAVAGGVVEGCDSDTMAGAAARRYFGQGSERRLESSVSGRPRCDPVGGSLQVRVGSSFRPGSG